MIKESLEKSHEIEGKYNAFDLILDEVSEKEVTDNILSGIPYGV